MSDGYSEDVDYRICTAVQTRFEKGLTEAEGEAGDLFFKACILKLICSLLGDSVEQLVIFTLVFEATKITNCV